MDFTGKYSSRKCFCDRHFIEHTNTLYKLNNKRNKKNISHLLEENEKDLDVELHWHDQQTANRDNFNSAFSSFENKVEGWILRSKNHQVPGGSGFRNKLRLTLKSFHKGHRSVKLSRRKSLSPLAPGSCLSRALRKLNFRICCEKMLLLFCHIYSAAWRQGRKSEKVNLFAVRVNNKLSSKLGAKTKLNKSLLTF